MACRLELAVREAVMQSIPQGSAILVAVSGGGDSVALLYLLKRACHRRENRLTVAHLDHGLRRGSIADRRFVEQLSHALSLECVSDRREVGKLRRKDESPEEAARRVRREFLIGAARESESDLIATGHTVGDQAETILMRMVRGAGATALTGMARVGPGPFVRPLLGIDGGALRAYLEQRDIPFRDDPTNRQLRFDRNRVRRLILPMISETLNPRAAENLVRAAGHLREDALFLDEMARERFELLSRTDRRGRLHISARELEETAPVLAKRIARCALMAGGADPRRIASRHIEALLDLARPGKGRELHLPTGLLARRERTDIVLERTEKNGPNR